MAVEIANAILNITPSLNGMSREIDRQLRGVDARRAGAGVGDDFASGFGSAAKKLAAVVAGAFAGVKLKDFAVDAINNASDLNEVGTKIQQVFGDGAAEVQAFGKQGAKVLGQTNLQAQNAAATFGVFGKAAGLAGKENAAFSTELAKLATDMASFSNTTPEQAIEALAAGLRGESEPLRSYGVLLDDASLRQEALAQGLITTTKDALTPQQKVLAAHALIMKQTADAQGDFERTSSGLANQQRILAAQWEDSKGKLGEAFLPAVTSVVAAMNDKLFPILETAGAKVSDAWKLLSTGDFQGGTSLGDEDSPLVNALFTARDVFQDTKGVIQEAWSILAAGDFKGGLGLEEDSPLVDFLFQLRDFGLTTLDRFQGIWEKVKTAAVDMWPSIKSIAQSLAEATASVGVSTWDIFLGIIDSLADALNDYLVPALDWLAGFMRENPGLVSTLVAAYTGYKVAVLAINVATTAWTAVQAALNAVMTANPIVLVIAALAALAAGVIWAYNNVEWFRDLVDNAWDVIVTASKWAWEHVLKPTFEFIVDALQKAGDFFSWLWDTVSDVWTWISDKVSTVWNWLRDNVFKPLGDGIVAVGDFFSGLWQTVSDVWTWISDKVTTVWNWIRDNIFAPLKTGIESVGTFFSDLWTTVSNVWTWIGDKIQGIWDNVINPIWTKLKEFITAVGAFFSGIWDGVKSVVEDVKGFIADITKAIDDFFGKVEQQAEAQGLKTGDQTTAGPFSSAGNPLAGMGMYADGGVVPGYMPGVDTQPAMLSPGEGILRPEVVRALGADTILGWNAAAKKNKFAGGGIVGLHAMGTLTGDILEKAAKDLLAGKRDQVLATPLFSVDGGLNPSQDPSSFGWQRGQGIVPFSWQGHPFVGGVAGGTEGLWAGLLNALVPQIPGGLMAPIWAYENRNNVNSPGNASFHAYGLAADINAPQNPNGASGYGRSGPGVIPSAAAHALAAKFGMIWGGDFTGTPDPMHFEIHVSPDQIRGGSVTAAPAGVEGGKFPPMVERWRSLGLDVLGKVGQYKGLSLTQYIDRMLNQIRTESSGDPNAINNYDINARRGDPSIGLLQVIGSTFRAALKGTPFEYLIAAGQRDPRASLTSSTLYSLNRYGSLDKAWRGVAYDSGGWLMPGVTPTLNLLNKPEAVLTPPQSDALITHAQNLARGFGGRAELDPGAIRQALDGMSMQLEDGGNSIRLIARREAVAVAAAQSRVNRVNGGR